MRVDDLVYPEAAESLRISVRTLKQLVAEKKITCNRPSPRRVTFSPQHLDEYRAKVAQKARA